MRVVPRMIVRFMDVTGALRLKDTFSTYRRILRGSLSSIVELAETLPPELTPPDIEKQLALSAGLASIKAALEQFYARGGAVRLYGMPGFAGRKPLEMIYDALSGLPDSVPAAETKGLGFIEDEALRDSIRLDLSDGVSALRNNAWKAATVLAGSVIEALLLWELTKYNHPDDQSKLRSISARPLEHWTLHQYLEGARQLGCLKPTTIEVADQAKEFRDLIHPGRAQRLQTACDLGTAHVAVGAADHVARDLAQALCLRHRYGSGGS